MMKCMSCNAEIPAAWKSCIAKNICPGCDGPIMDEASNELLSEIKDAFERMPNDPTGLAGWLLSNYTLRKIGDAQPTNFHSKPSQQDIVNEQNLKIADNPLQKMLKRTGMSNSIETSRKSALAALAKNIKKNSGIEDEPAVEETEEFPQEDDEEYISPPQKISSALASIDDGDVDPSYVNTLEEAISVPDGLAGTKYENIQRMKRLKGQEGIMSGAGGFRRS